MRVEHDARECSQGGKRKKRNPRARPQRGKDDGCGKRRGRVTRRETRGLSGPGVGIEGKVTLAVERPGTQASDHALEDRNREARSPDGKKNEKQAEQEHGDDRKRASRQIEALDREQQQDRDPDRPKNGAGPAEIIEILERQLEPSRQAALPGDRDGVEVQERENDRRQREAEHDPGPRPEQRPRRDRAHVAAAPEAEDDGFRGGPFHRRTYSRNRAPCIEARPRPNANGLRPSRSSCPSAIPCSRRRPR